jgi:hypothetical protein
MDLMAFSGKTQTQFGRDNAGASIGGVTNYSDLHAGMMLR